MKEKRKLKCFSMPYEVYENLPEEMRRNIRAELIKYGFIKTVEKLNKYMDKKR